MRIPEDIQVIGIGRTGLTTYMVPRPTTISAEPYRLSQEIARIAIDLARDHSTPKPNIVIPMQLVQGETTGSGDATQSPANKSRPQTASVSASKF